MAHNLARAVGAIADADLARPTVATPQRTLAGWCAPPGDYDRACPWLALADSVPDRADTITALPMRC